jgi:methylenetetrahydrofolate dehydrogenase (NADP+) / methenyltetrahydrofolate cyclohydrolase
MILNGRQIADEVLETLREKVAVKNLKLKLAAVLVGDDPEFKKFVELKGTAAKSIGVSFRAYQFPENITTKKLKEEIINISANSNGVAVELPIPERINSREVLNEIPVKKDVDVLSSEAQVRFYQPQPQKIPGLILPPAVEALKMVFQKTGIELKGKKAAVFGQGMLVGNPVSHWLEQHDFEVYKIRETTKDAASFSKEADIVIAGVGKPGLITADMIKDKAIVIDYGYGKKDNKMIGDVDFDSVAPKTSFITPVPGGMGPILVAAVLKNLISLNS